jgi:hypothetical protein
MGEKSLPARKGGEVRGSESIKFRAVAPQAALVGASPPPGSFVAVLPPSLRSGGREIKPATRCMLVSKNFWDMKTQTR